MENSKIGRSRSFGSTALRRLGLWQPARPAQVRKTVSVKETMYDQLYQAGQAVLARAGTSNPCLVANGRCAKGPLENGATWCCVGCVHLGPRGCTVEALACKLWLCGVARSNQPSLAHQLDILNDQAVEGGLQLMYRTSRQQYHFPEKKA